MIDDKLLITGDKKGKKKQKPPYMAKVSARSTSVAKLLIALSEGEVEASGQGVLSSKDIYLDNTPITNPDGSVNYDVKWEFRKGTQNQEHINSLPSIENYHGVNFKLSTATPYVRTITNTDIDQIRVNLSFPVLQRATDKGDYYATEVRYAIDIATTTGGWVEYGSFALNARFTSEYQRTHEFNLPPSSNGWRVRVRRLTPDSNDMMLQNDMSVAGITEVVDAKLRYPNTSLLYLEFDAEMFSSLPKVSVRMKGKVVRIPDNYDPVSRTYSGVWSGRWKWGYSNNPVWCLMDTLLSENHGLGIRLTIDQIDKWGFYHIAKWCDVYVDDGYGGKEPRHTLNVYIQKQVDAWRLLQDICSNFNGSLFWNGEQVELYADIPSEIVYTYNRSNVVDGVFTDAGMDIKNKFTQALVSWDNPDNRFETDKTHAYDVDLTRRFGVRKKDIPAFGVTSEGQAQRKGLWTLTANMFDRHRSFKVGLDGFIPRLGELVAVADNRFAGAPMSGRVASVKDNRTVVLDRECRVKVGDRLTINLPNGVSETRTIDQVNGTSIRVSMRYSITPKSGVAFHIDSDDLKALTMRIVKVEHNEDNTFSINAVEYNSSKQDYIDHGALIQKDPSTITPVSEISPPTNARIDYYSTVEQGLSVAHVVFKWGRVKNAVLYEVQWSKDDGEWISVPRTPNSEVTISGIYQGIYRFRVRAISAMELASVYTESDPKYIYGKVGEVSELAYLRTTSEVMGIRLDWGFKEKSEDSSKTIIMINTAPVDEGATVLGEFSYPTDTYTHRGLAHAVELYFKGRVKDKLGGESEWTEWIHGSSSADADEILSYLDGKIEETHLGQWLKDEIGKIDEIDDLQTRIDELETIIQELEDVPFFDPTVSYTKGDMVKFDNVIYAAKKDVPAGIAPPNDEYWENIGGFESLNDIVSALVTEVRHNTTKIEQQDGKITSIGNQQNIINNKVTDHETKLTAQSAAISNLNTKVEQTDEGLKATSEKVDGVYSLVKPDMAGSTEVMAGSTQAQAGVWSVWSSITEHDIAMASRVDQVTAQVGDNKAAIQQESITRATQVDAVAKQITTLQAKVDDDISAAIQDIEEVVATETEALSRRINTAQAGVDGNKSAIQTEAQTRASADAALGRRVDTVQASIADEVAKVNGVKHVMDLSGLNADTYYPVVFPLNANATKYSFMVDVPLNTYTAPWASHNSGTFSCAIIWRAFGSGWGRRPEAREVLTAWFAWTDQSPFLDVGQLINSSREYVYLRGGTKYNVYAPSGVTPYIVKTSETHQTQTIAPKAYSAASVTKTDYAETTASVQQISQAQATTDGKLNAMWGVKLQVNDRGEYVTAGVGLGIDNTSGIPQSKFIVQANQFIVQDGLNGSGQTAFTVDNGQVIIRTALIGDATINMAKIGGDLYSTNYVAGRSGWRLQQNGNFEINSTIEGEGRVEINNKGVRVYDANGRLRVKLGDLR